MSQKLKVSCIPGRISTIYAFNLNSRYRTLRMGSVFSQNDWSVSIRNAITGRRLMSGATSYCDANGNKIELVMVWRKIGSRAHYSQFRTRSFRIFRTFSHLHRNNSLCQRVGDLRTAKISLCPRALVMQARPMHLRSFSRSARNT